MDDIRVSDKQWMMMADISDSALTVFVRQIPQTHRPVSQCHDEQRLML